MELFLGSGDGACNKDCGGALDHPPPHTTVMIVAQQRPPARHTVAVAVVGPRGHTSMRPMRMQCYCCALFLLLVGAKALPHLFMIVLDDVGFTDHELFSASDIPTPALLRMANEGTTPRDAWHLFFCVPPTLPSFLGFLPSFFECRPSLNAFLILFSGILLSQFRTQPVCSPTRSSLLTGRYPFRDGMQHINTLLPGSRGGIPPETPTLPELLRELNYERHMVGKWHLGYASWSQT
jgi:arylsulfatase A-like enzyme